jgi:tetratricopeptide (TPR) repeat protein
MSNTAAPQNPPPSRIEADVLRMRHLIGQRQYDAALALGTKLLAEVPANRDVRYMQAVAQRYLGRPAEALKTLAELEKIHPDYSRLHQERGHCWLAARNPAAALDAYLRAVSINVALPGSWKALETLFRSAGRTEDADTARAHGAKLASLPTPVVTATSMFADGEIHAAEQVLRSFLLQHPQDIEAMRLLAQIGVRLDILDDAEFLLESVLAFAPDYQLARCDYVRVLLQRHKNVRALEESRKLLAADPKDRNFRTLFATSKISLGQFEDALAIYRELAAEQPVPDLYLSMGHALKTLGRQREAIVAYHEAAALRPDFGDAYWSLANLKTFRFADDDIAAMRLAEATPRTKRADRYHLCFALGKALEDRNEFASAFEYYERGNALKKSEIRYRPEPVEHAARRQVAVFTPEFIAARRGIGCERPDPIFIVGLPRAGSTLLEQILASHSKVEGTMELADVPRLVQLLQGRDHDEMAPRYPDVVAGLSPEQLQRFGEKYLADTQVYRTGKPFFIDKMPNNFRHVGLIHLMLPNARIIDARREPMACCFSNFKQLFANGQEFTYGLDDIARYYRTYVELMEHWDRVLPGRILRVQHEDVVEDLEGNVRRLLEFCSLDFEPGCLEFYKNERSVRTASSEQVRQPIFKEGLDQWRHFEPWLGPLKQSLGSLADPLRWPEVGADRVPS